jgi:hypothetical protein
MEAYVHWREAMSGKQNKRYRKTIRKLKQDNRLDLAAIVRRAGRPVRRRALLRAWAGGDPEALKVLRKEIVKHGRVEKGPAKLFLAEST